ncbi:MAG: hypothetical protein DMG67_13650 [Acidobacteria bacterium]|nr:MAG: hypothetical protein DMG67_13650 [Acidobacteriota bacterium]
MKFGKLLILAFAAAFCLTLSANAQLGVGGAVKGTTGAVGNVGGQTGAVKGTLDSTTQLGGDLQNGANGNLNSTNQAAAKAEKKRKKRNSSEQRQERLRSNQPIFHGFPIFCRFKAHGGKRGATEE